MHAIIIYTLTTHDTHQWFLYSNPGYSCWKSINVFNKKKEIIVSYISQKPYFFRKGIRGFNEYFERKHDKSEAKWPHVLSPPHEKYNRYVMVMLDSTK